MEGSCLSLVSSNIMCLYRYFRHHWKEDRICNTLITKLGKEPGLELGDSRQGLGPEPGPGLKLGTGSGLKLELGPGLS